MSPALALFAESVNDSPDLMALYAAVEWDCLSDDGKQWVAALVKETLSRAALVADQEISRIFSTSASGHGSNAAKRIRDSILGLAALCPPPATSEGIAG